MPTIQLIVGSTANLGAGQVNGDLTVLAPSAGTFTISVGGGAAVPVALGAGGHSTTAVNGSAVVVINTTAGVQPPAGTLLLSW